jgi:tRNA (guanine9-N1)-methyltransferase
VPFARLGLQSESMSDADSQLEPDKQQASSSAGASTEVAPPLSKKAQKKAAKAARLAAQKLERRAREKETKKEKKRLKRAAQEQDDEDEAESAIPRKRVRVSKPSGPVIKFGARLVIDLGFDDKMTEKVCSIAFRYNCRLLTTHDYRKSCP